MFYFSPISKIYISVNFASVPCIFRNLHKISFKVGYTTIFPITYTAGSPLWEKLFVNLGYALAPIPTPPFSSILVHSDWSEILFLKIEEI